MSKMPSTSEQVAPPDEGSRLPQNGAAATEMVSSSNEIPPAAKERLNQTIDSQLLSESRFPARSPKHSREVSPMRPQTQSSLPTSTQRNPSRKNSQELSPSRSANMSSLFASIPSAAAVQRALSANKPAMQSSSGDGIIE